MTKKLLSALSLMTCALQAEPINSFNQSLEPYDDQTIVQSKKPVSARQRKDEQKALKRQKRKNTRGQRRRRGWGITAGILGFLALAAIPLLLFSACVGGGLAAIK